MNSKIKEIILRLLSFRNIVPLLIIIGAFVGTFVPTPFGLGRDQLLLGLLAFLAIDALIERLELLTNIEKDVRALKESIASRTATKDFLRRRKDFPRLEHLITEARKEVWVSGISLDTMATLVGVFNSKLKEGLNLRFLSVSLQKRVIQDTSGYIGRDVDELEGRIRANHRYVV